MFPTCGRAPGVPPAPGRVRGRGRRGRWRAGLRSSSTPAGGRETRPSHRTGCGAALNNRPSWPPRIDRAELLGALTDAVIIADTAGRILYVNPAADRMLGAAAGELIGRPLVEIIPPRLRPAHLAGWARFVDKG